uniref:Uncharacterized protein n=1 Tax=Glossina austeni TaxID=7395 RepID=A0A1A9V760_GLOAU
MARKLKPSHSQTENVKVLCHILKQIVDPSDVMVEAYPRLLKQLTKHSRTLDVHPDVLSKAKIVSDIFFELCHLPAYFKPVELLFVLGEYFRHLDFVYIIHKYLFITIQKCLRVFD